jgi:hypothetical protein
MDALLCKWVIKALKLGNSNLKLLLHFKLTMCKPSKHMNLGPKMNWVLVGNHNPSLVKGIGEDLKGLETNG